jgi:anti-sigma-K factor RskA
MTHEEYKEMLAEYALGALGATEARALETHLATCAECRAELSEWRDTAGALAYSAPSFEPPPALRSRLLESVSAIKTQASVGASAPGSVSVERAATGRTAPTPLNVIALPSRERQQQRPRQSFWQRYGALAAALAFAALLVTLFVVWNRDRARQAEIARLARDLQTTQEQLRREQEKSGMLTAQDTSFVNLAGTQMAPQAHARLAVNKSGSAMMVAEGLPQAPAGHDYQIWFIADGKPIPGGVFKPDAAGHAEMREQIPVQARGATAFAVTLEPQGGTSAPTGQKYLLGAASS